MSLSDWQTVFSGNPLDRADHLRDDPEVFGAISEAPDSRFLLVAEDRFLSADDGGLLWLDPEQRAGLVCSNSLFLGLEQGAARYALQLEGTVEELADRFAPAKFRDARALALKRGRPDPALGILAQAKSMLNWHQRHGFCARCGAPSEIARAGYERRCPRCGAGHFPRTDPVVIMLALHADRALVGRGPQLPPGMYSALAGFLEPGETIEEAVARELAEEAGVVATAVRYVTSQPWPWPSSLMIGCCASVRDEALHLDGRELEDARWISRDEARQGIAQQSPDFALPPPLAIARTLIDAWLAESG